MPRAARPSVALPSVNDLGPAVDERVGLERLDAALGRLRRLWEQPGVRDWFRGRLDLDEVAASVYRTLRAVNQLGPDGASVNGVAELLRVDGSTASRFLDRATAAGYVQRAASARDRRRSSFTLSAEGRRRLLDLRDLRVGLLEQLTHDWSADDVDTLIVLLERFDDAVVGLGIEDVD
jgi:DNA-binding MarR family transcriptional regulator